MENSGDTNILIIYGILGTLILIGYARMAMRNSGYINSVWTNNGTNMIVNNNALKSIYTIMILLSVISGIYLIKYLYGSEQGALNKESNIIIYVGSVIFLIPSVIWAFYPFWNSKIVLFTVLVGLVIILVGIVRNRMGVEKGLGNDAEKDQLNYRLAIVATSILIIQAGLFDFLIWNGIINF
jgi:hypothetical protein